MKVIKNINNNICLCIDSKGREVIAFGKGIGFIRPPHEIPLEKINRTFLNVKDNDFSALKDLPIEIINVAIRIIDRASDVLDVTYPSSAYLSMADHISFSIRRGKENMWLDLPLVQDIKMLYPKEMELAFWSLKLINEVLKADLQRNEAAAIALHLINDRQPQDNGKEDDTWAFIEEILQGIEEDLDFRIDRESFNVSRFIIHLDYLLKRVFTPAGFSFQNKEVTDALIRRSPEAYKAMRSVSEKISERYHVHLSPDEEFYLLIYINKLYSR